MAKKVVIILVTFMVIEKVIKREREEHSRPIPATSQELSELYGRVKKLPGGTLMEYSNIIMNYKFNVF